MEKKELDFIIGDADQQLRIDIFLSRKTELSRSMIQKLIDEDHIIVNNSNIRSSYKLKLNDRVLVTIPAPKESKILPQNIPISIIYEDKDIVVIDKQPGLVVHPAESVKDNTLVNAIMHHIKDLSSIGGEHKPGIVHRLDKDTSGLIMIAKNDNAHIDIQKQIMDRKVKKLYKALVFGIVRPKNGVIKAPIGRNPSDRKKMTVILDDKLKSREATTAYKIVKEYKGYSLLELDLKTGRTHQIRVHLLYLGHPIVGDRTYTKRKNVLEAPRQMLHACLLGFTHPRTKQYMEFKSDLPEDFTMILGRLE